MVILYRASDLSDPSREDPDVQSLGSVRLPLPPSRRPDRGRHRRRQRDARDPDVIGPVVGWLARRRTPNRRRSRPGSTPSSAPARARSSLSSDPTTPGADATSAEFQGAIATAIAGLASTPHVSGIIGYAETGDPRFISTAGDAAYIVIELDLTDEESVEIVDDIRAAIVAPAGYSYQLTGYGPITKDSAEQSEKDLQKAEIVSLPIVALILILVFASIVAAGMPLLVAGLAIPSSLAIIYVVAQQVEMSIFVLNIATMLGLALAIDYSLFIVSRFREELRRGRTVAEAVERTVATAGKAVAFSGIAVAIGLSGLLLFEAPAIRSIGIAGAIVVALLGRLRADVPAGRPRDARASRQRAVARLDCATASGRSPTASSRPGPRAGNASRTPSCGGRSRCSSRHSPSCSSSAARSCASSRASRAPRSTRPASRAATPTSRSRPSSPPARRPRSSSSPTSRAHRPTSPTSRRSTAYAASVDGLEGIDRVESPFVIRDPATGALLTPEQVAALYALPADQRPPELDALLERYVRGSTVRLDAISPLPPSRPESTDLIPVIRAIDPGAGITTQVGGSAAIGHDFLVSQAERAPYAVGLTLLASGVILFFLFGSLAIPIKAVIMTLLSITASFGAMVWIFQEGNLSNLLNFEPLGYTIAGNPIIMFSVIFGLSMDYEVLLLSRIQEAYRKTGDNTASVAEGLSKTAGVITGAALIMVSVFAAFALAEVITIKSIGVGMAIAVAIDATIVRVLLVPATMRLMGKWNWWAPGFLGRFADRLGFSHVEDDDDPTPQPVANPV